MLQSEQDLLDLIDHPVFVIEQDAAGQAIYVAMNRHALSRLGKPLSDVVGRTAKDLYPGQLGTHAYRQHMAALQSGQPCSYELTLPLKARMYRLRTTLRPVDDGNGAILRLIGTSTEVVAKNVIATSDETMDAELENFISLAAHDLRTPMRHVMGIADMLAEDFQDMGDGKLEMIHMIEEIGTKAMRLVDDVLAYARATTSTTAVVEFSLSELFSELLSVLDPKGRMTWQASDTLLLADRSAVLVVLRNLIDNALKHAGAPEDLCITADVTVQHGFVEICVRDNGVGFSDETVLFADEGKLTTSNNFGLFGVRRLIASRGGALNASNAPDGTGATISFSLPGLLGDDRLRANG